MTAQAPGVAPGSGTSSMSMKEGYASGISRAAVALKDATTTLPRGARVAPPEQS